VIGGSTELWGALIGAALLTLLKDWLKDQICESIDQAREHGIDKPEITDWKWPYE